jgi:hypothetical protein
VGQRGLRCTTANSDRAARSAQAVVLQPLTSHAQNSEISGKNIFPDRKAILAPVQPAVFYKTEKEFSCSVFATFNALNTRYFKIKCYFCSKNNVETVALTEIATQGI